MNFELSHSSITRPPDNGGRVIFYIQKSRLSLINSWDLLYWNIIGDDALHRSDMAYIGDFVAGVFSWFTAFHCRGSLHFLFAQKMKQKMLSRAPTVLLIITPFADAYRCYFTRKIIISLTYILTEIGAQTAYGNISNVALSLVMLRVYFCIFVCTAHSQTSLSLIYI